ncbi:MAG TPA: transporter substrate-binding domain-containing protein [Flexivirga sp.]|uniref:transporter substrate-binding domain-containing protein n=1 Tax=Flexivirga sp. TaxID=1962927 RepID=UPI002B6B872A|nr:transporter substrate-binding domain-containing protein [Flexivirga sp.]HWC21556.1 transporter substrate-binding domain-containing protein [Flexivirga sp.]
MDTTTTRNTRRQLLGVATALGVAATLAACGSSSGGAAASGGGAAGAGGAKAAPADFTGKISVDSAARKLLPQSVRKSGKLILGTTQVTGTAGLPHAGIVDGKEAGLDLDIRAAVAKKLGISWQVETGTFQTIIPGVQSGKYQVGQGNFGVTKEREKVVDFATYLNDGQAFVGSKDVQVKRVKSLLDICGLKVATTSGTTFQKLLTSFAPKCAAAGKKPYHVQYFSDTAPIYLGLQNGKVDVFFGPTLSQKVVTQKIPGTRFLGQITQTPVGFVTARKSPVASAIQAAVNDLIKDGTYGKIFAKWKVASSVIKQSQLNPPATF